MDFNFREQFQNLSTLELLIMLEQPEGYQKAAIEAAQFVLNQREITEADKLEAKRHFISQAQKRKERTDQIRNIQNQVEDFLQPIVKPEANLKPNKWLNIFLLVFALKFLWSLKATLPYLWSVIFKCDNCSVDLYLIANTFSLFYLPLIFYLLYKRRKWGWILIFADNLFTIMCEISQSYVFFKFQEIYHWDIAAYLFNLTFHVVFLSFLWREDISDFFCVPVSTKKLTVKITVVSTILFMALTLLI